MNKQIIDARVLENRKIADQVYRMVIHSPDAVNDYVAGRFINVYLKDKSMLLPRPISICETEGENLILAYRVAGKGTAEIAQYICGEEIRISTPLGNGFQIDNLFIDHENENRIQTRRIGLVGGGIGIPPLIGLAKSIKKILQERQYNVEDNQKSQPIKLIAYVGFQREPFLLEELKKYCDDIYIATDEGSFGFHGNVMELINQEKKIVDAYYACGPKPMLKALTLYSREQRIPVQISMEERMGCGYGACVGCTCSTKKIDGNDLEIMRKKVCKDGPVFLGAEVIWDEN